MQYLLLCSQCGEVDSYFSNLLKNFPAYSTINLFFFLNLISLVDDNQQSVWPFYLGLFGLNLLASKAFDLPHPTKGRSSS